MGDFEQRQTSVDITPEMIEAGKEQLIACIGDDRWIGGDDDVVTKIFLAMYEKALNSTRQ